MNTDPVPREHSAALEQCSQWTLYTHHTKELDMRYLVARLREPSTWAGIAALLAALGVTVDPRVFEGVQGLVTALAGLLAVLLPERDRT